jgi:hypothetical protein
MGLGLLSYWRSLGKRNDPDIGKSSEFRLVLHLRKYGDIRLGPPSIIARFNRKGKMDGAQRRRAVRPFQLIGFTSKKGRQQKENANIPTAEHRRLI